MKSTLGKSAGVFMLMLWRVYVETPWDLLLLNLCQWQEHLG